MFDEEYEKLDKRYERLDEIGNRVSKQMVGSYKVIFNLSIEYISITISNDNTETYIGRLPISILRLSNKSVVNLILEVLKMKGWDIHSFIF